MHEVGVARRNSGRRPHRNRNAPSRRGRSRVGVPGSAKWPASIPDSLAFCFEALVKGQRPRPAWTSHRTRQVGQVGIRLPGAGKNHWHASPWKAKF